jgi:sulfur carrier protein
MQLIINGENKTADDATTVAGLLASLDIDPDTARGIAVALNERIVRQPEWAVRMLREGDRVEVVTAQQGG